MLTNQGIATKRTRHTKEEGTGKQEAIYRRAADSRSLVAL
jgi:hypothetical protein